MKQTFIYLSIVGLISLFSGCATMYPGTLDENSKLEKHTAILLIGVKGKRAVNYLQYCSFTCKNYRFTPISNEIIALRVDSQTSEIRLDSYTTTDISAGYTIQGTGFGYQTTKNLALNIKKVGIYYHGILNTDTGLFTSEPDNKLLSIAKEKYNDKLLSIQPVNFKWPE